MREKFCLALFVLAATLGAFNGGIWGALGIAGAVLLFISTWLADRKIPLPPRAIAWLAFTALAVFAAELPLSFNKTISLHVWLQLASIFIPLLLLTAPRVQSLSLAPRFAPIVALALGVGAAALGIELFSGGAILHHVKGPGASLTEYNRGIAHMALLAFPVCAALWSAGRKRAVLALALLLLFPASLTESHTAKLALIAGAACTAAAFYRSVRMRNLLALFAVLLLGFPFYAQWVFTHDTAAIAGWHMSWGHRMEIWDYLSYRIMDRPLFGWGLGTTHLLDLTQPHGQLYHYATRAAAHGHNMIVELWVETGLAGLVFGLAFLLLSLRAAFRLDAALRPFALGGWIAAVIISLFGFDFWTDALWSAFALSAFAFGMLQQKAEGERHLLDA